MTRGVVIFLATVLLAAPACGRSLEEPQPSAPPRCDAGLSVPDGFEVVGTVVDRAPGHIGVRLDLKADDGRELHYFSGIPGEFGEGLGDHGDVRLADGSTGRLAGDDTTWVLEWEDSTRCTPTVVLGTGMQLPSFRRALRAAGALPSR